MRQKENIKELFFNYSTKHWHFEELVKKSGLTRTNTNLWLKRLTKEGLVRRVKPKRKMPYYLANFSEIGFKMQKRLYAFQQFEKTGFLEHLSSLPKAKTVVIFGSFARADWDYESDIDLFIYGDADGFKQGKFEQILKREIQLFEYDNPQKLKRIENVVSNIMAGIHVKGKIEPFVVKIHA